MGIMPSSTCSNAIEWAQVPWLSKNSQVQCHFSSAKADLVVVVLTVETDAQGLNCMRSRSVA